MHKFRENVLQDRKADGASTYNCHVPVIQNCSVSWYLT